MKIKTKLQIVIIMNVVVFTAIILSSSLLIKEVDRLQERAHLVSKLHYSIFETSQALNEYLMGGEERPKEQWHLLHERTLATLNILSGENLKPRERDVVKNIIRYHNSSAGLFNQLINLDKGTAARAAQTQALRERIVSQLLLMSHVKYQEALKLREIVHEDRGYHLDRLHLYNNFSFGLLALLMVCLAIIIIRNISHPLTRLHEGTKMIAGGNLDYKTNIRTRDEIGRLSAAFDTMTERIKKITVSRYELSKEVEMRILAEEALRILSSRQQAILAAVPEIIMEVNTSKVYTWTNSAGFEFFGKDVIGKEAAFYFEGEQDTYDKVSPVFNGVENIIYVESWQRRTDGEKRLLAWWCRVLKDEIGQVTGALSTARDITERRQAEEALHHSMVFMDNIINHSPHAMWISDDKGTLIRLNQACCDLFHVEADELVGKYNVLQDTIVEEQGYMPLVKRVFEQGQSVRFPLQYDSERLTNLDLKERVSVFLDVTISAVLDASGRVEHAIIQHVDITERKRAEEALRKSEEQLACAIEGSGVGLWDWYVQTGKTVFNERWAEIVGYTLSELSPVSIDTWGNLSHPDDLERSNELLKEHFSKQSPSYECEARMRHKDGHWVWVLDRGKVTEWSGDDLPIRMTGTHLDITERKRTETALRKSEEKFRNIFDNASEGIFQTTQEGRILSVNKAFANIFRYESPEEIIKEVTDTGRQLYVSPDDRERFASILREAGILKGFECQMRRKNDATFWASINARFAKLPDGTPCFEGFIIDITERKRAEDEVKHNEARLKSLVNILQHRADSIQDFFDYALDEAIALTGSKIGYILNYHEDKKEFILNTWSKDVMKEWTIAEPPTAFQLDKAGIWGEAVRQRQPVVLNDFPAPHPLKKGHPEGHATLCNFMTVPVFTGDHIVAVVGVANKDSDYSEPDILQLTLLMDSVWKVVDLRRSQEELQHTLERLRRAIRATIQVTLSAIEARDPYTAGHQERSSDLARSIAKEMGLPPEKIDAVRMAGIVHDIGKLSIPSEILSKPTKLSKTEFSLIKEHAKKGCEILKDVESPWPLAEMVHQHHERMDGSGYPRGIKGEEILMEARILAVADVVEAIASHRPYRPALGIDTALEEIEKNKGTLYDASVVDACLRLFREKRFQFR